MAGLEVWHAFPGSQGEGEAQAESRDSAWRSSLSLHPPETHIKVLTPKSDGIRRWGLWKKTRS